MINEQSPIETVQFGDIVTDIYALEITATFWFALKAGDASTLLIDAFRNAKPIEFLLRGKLFSNCLVATFEKEISQTGPTGFHYVRMMPKYCDPHLLDLLESNHE